MSPRPIDLRRVRAGLARLQALVDAYPELREPETQARLTAWLEKEERTMTGQKDKPKGDTTAYVRMQRMRERRKQAGWQPYELWLDPETSALLSELKQSGEALHTLVRRALRALAREEQGDHAGETLSPVQRKAAVLTRLWAMEDEGLSHQAMANRLNAEHEPTLSRRGQWQAGTVGKLLKAYPRHES
jgi:hypothetical protein